MSENLLDLIYHIAPKESPFIGLVRHNKRRLGPPRRGMRAMRRRVARAPIKVALSYKMISHEWVTHELAAQ